MSGEFENTGVNPCDAATVSKKDTVDRVSLFSGKYPSAVKLWLQNKLRNLMDVRTDRNITFCERKERLRIFFLCKLR